MKENILKSQKNIRVKAYRELFSQNEQLIASAREELEFFNERYRRYFNDEEIRVQIIEIVKNIKTTLDKLYEDKTKLRRVINDTRVKE